MVGISIEMDDDSIEMVDVSIELDDVSIVMDDGYPAFDVIQQHGVHVLTHHSPRDGRQFSRDR